MPLRDSVAAPRRTLDRERRREPIEPLAVVATPSKPPASLQVGTYLFVGGLTFVVDTSALQATWMMGVSLPVATTLGYFLGAVCHFTLNRALTFRARGTDVGAQIVPYLVNLGISYVITLAVVNGGHWLVASWPIALWKGVAVAVTMTITFLMLRHVVFRHDGQPAGPSGLGAETLERS